MGVVIDQELGVDISCDPSGAFSATVSGHTVRDKSLNKVRNAIRTAAPTITALIDSRYSGLTLAELAVVKPYAGRILGVESTIADARYSGAKTHYDPYEYDATIIAAMVALNQDITTRKNTLTDEYDEKLDELKKSLVPLTPERFAQLLEEKSAK